MSMKRIAVAVALSAGLAGCAAGLPPKVRDRIASTEVHLGIPQAALGAQGSTSRAGVAVAAGNNVGGMSGVMGGGTNPDMFSAYREGAKSAREREAEAYIAPLQPLVADIDFDGRLRQGLDAALAATPVLHAQPVQVFKQVGDDALFSRFQGAGSDAVLFVMARYVLDENLASLQVSAEAQLFARSPALRKAAGKSNGNDSLRTALEPPKALYRSKFMVESRLPGPVADKAANLAAWQKDGLLHGALERGIDELAARIQADLRSAMGSAR